MQRDINITITLEGVDRFSIRVPLDQEKKAKEAERIVNHLYNSWKEKFTSLTPLELMGRISFHLARKFEDLNSNLVELQETVSDCESEFDHILLDME